MKKEEKKKKPFFARFLESQELEEVKGGALVKPRPPVTLKYPSDDDEGGIDL